LHRLPRQIGLEARHGPLILTAPATSTAQGRPRTRLRQRGGAGQGEGAYSAAERWGGDHLQEQPDVDPAPSKQANSKRPSPVSLEKQGDGRTARVPPR